MKGNYLVFTFDIEHFQLNILKKTKKVVFRDEIHLKTLPDVIKIYEPFDTTLCKYYINEIGQVVSLYKILQTLNGVGLHKYFQNYATTKDKEETHKKILKDIKNTFGASIEPDSISILSVNQFKIEKIKWDHYRILEDKFQTFIECQFIFQLTKSFDKNLMNYQKNHKSYYYDKIMWNLSPSFFSIKNPRDFIINDDERKKYDLFYDSWYLTDTCKSLNEKFNLLMKNSSHKNEKTKSNQQNILNFFLLAITIFSTLAVIPVLENIFPNTINKKLLAIAILIIASIFFLILFYRPILLLIKELYYRIKNFITLNRIKQNKL